MTDGAVLAFVDLWSINIPVPVALAAVAVLGYLFGRRTRPIETATQVQARRELKRAQLVARELEAIAETIRKNLAAHSGCIARFKERVHQLSREPLDTSWQQLCNEAEEMLKPTLLLATQVAHAYDEIRQQSNHLMTFTEVRTDPLTGVSNRRALDETLDSMFAMMQRYDHSFSLVILDIDNFKLVNDQRGHLFGDRILKSVARLIDESVRDTDVVSRYGGEEFVIVMPQTPLDGANVFAERLRKNIEENLTVRVSAGVAEALDGDNPQTLLARADAALYGAKAAGRNRVFQHTGTQLEPVSEEQPQHPSGV